MGWVIVQVPLLLFAFCLPVNSFGHSLLWPTELSYPRHAVGVAAMIGGGLLLTFGIVGLGRNLTPLPSPKSGGGLVTTGIFRLVRHPVYGGIILMTLAHALPIPSAAALVLPVLVLAFFNRKATAEETILVQKFVEYDDYRRRTAKLIPWLY